LEWIDFDKVLDLPTPKTDWYIYQYILNDQKFCFNAEFNAELELLYMIDDLTNETIYSK
jgi:8-oxo-dGTP diphosphatase